MVGSHSISASITYTVDIHYLRELHCASQRTVMTDKTYWESFKAESEQIVDKIRDLIHEGNVRRVVVQQHGRTVAEFPLTVGVVGAVLAPVVAAIAAIVALAKDCTIQVERTEPTSASDEERRTKAG